MHAPRAARFAAWHRGTYDVTARLALRQQLCLVRAANQQSQAHVCLSCTAVTADCNIIMQGARSRLPRIWCEWSQCELQEYAALRVTANEAVEAPSACRSAMVAGTRLCLPSDRYRAVCCKRPVPTLCTHLSSYLMKASVRAGACVLLSTCFGTFEGSTDQLQSAAVRSCLI